MYLSTSGDGRHTPTPGFSMWVLAVQTRASYLHCRHLSIEPTFLEKAEFWVSKARSHSVAQASQELLIILSKGS